MAATSDQRALAIVLSGMDDAELASVLEARGISSGVSWRDFFDAAEGMLEPAAVARGLRALPRAHAVALADAVAAALPVPAPAAASLAAAALGTTDGRVFHTVAEAVREHGAIDAPPPPPPAAATPAAEAAAAERAFTATASLADILLRTLDTPLGRIGTGGLGAADRRSLVESGAASDPETADLLVGLAGAVGLLAPDERVWLATAAAREWVTAPTVERWRHVATRLRDVAPQGVRDDDGGWLPLPAWDGARPFDAGWPARAQRWRERAVLWGMATPEGAVPAWATRLVTGHDADLDLLQGFLPQEVDTVFLQNDLTAIAPGPLAPPLDVRLRSMTRRESRAQASTYRFDADTVDAAFTAGETADSMRAFLSALSLTGVPQPLDYLISRAATRHGLVRVGADPDTGWARVRSDDTSTIETIAVDQALRPLGLVREGAGLVSRLSPDAVFWALADARYPVVAVDADGAPHAIARARLGETSPPLPPTIAYAPLIARLRAESADAAGDAAWLERELDQAVRAKAVVDVVVALPDGSERTFRLEATGLGGGRLRGRDRGADVERTLPLRSIRSVHPTD